MRHSGAARTSPPDSASNCSAGLNYSYLSSHPLQKISTIEPFVEAVGYVRNDDPVSRLLTMTISEYRETRQRHLHQRRAARPGSPPAAMDADPDRGLEDGLADEFDHSSGGLDPLSRVS